MADFTFPKLSGAVVGVSSTSTTARVISQVDTVKEGLVLNLDASIDSSYVGAGSTWSSLIGIDAATLYNFYFESDPSYPLWERMMFTGYPGSYGIIDASDELNITDSDNFSIETWVYWTDNSNSGSYGQIFTQDDGGGSPFNFQFRIQDGSRKVSFIYQTGSTRATAQGLETVGAVTANEWNHLVVTYNGSTLSLYINGTLDISANVPTINSLSKNTAIGSFTSGSVDNLNGKISLIRVYKDRCLTDREVLNASRYARIETTNGTIRLPGNYLDVTVLSARTSMPPKRPQIGQLYPRGVYNK